MPRPRSKKSIKTKSKRPYVKRKRTYKRTVKGPFKAYVSNDPFPPRKACKLTIMEKVTLTAGTAGIFGTEFVMRLNSLYDPNFTEAGHQPYGFDSMAALYRKYIVNAVKIEILFTDPSQDGMVGGAFIQPSGGSATLTAETWESATEKPMMVTRVINNTGSQKAMVKQFFKMNTIEGLSKVQYNASLSNYSALVTANPTSTPYLRIAAANVQDATSGYMYASVKITYYCQFWERETLAQS